MEQTFILGQKMTRDMEKKNTFFDFVKEHKKVITIGAATACIVVVGVVIFKNRTATDALNIEKVAKDLKTHGDAISVKLGGVEVCQAWNLQSNKLINVSEHLRNLPDGWKASQSKIDLAARHGFSLGDHQTWVNSYAKAVS